VFPPVPFSFVSCTLSYFFFFFFPFFFFLIQITLGTASLVFFYTTEVPDGFPPSCPSIFILTLIPLNGPLRVLLHIRSRYRPWVLVDCPSSSAGSFFTSPGVGLCYRCSALIAISPPTSQYGKTVHEVKHPFHTFSASACPSILIPYFQLLCCSRPQLPPY